jgi:predicted AAA+ superfamily ATPase
MVELGILNQWWKGKEYVKEDKHIKEFEEKKFKWNPELLTEIKLTPDNIFILRGPRQVGKTTLLKLFIKDLLGKGIEEKAIFFWNCDELVDFRELSVVLREYLEFSKTNSIKERYIFLDEISRIKDWQRSIKSLKDSGELDKCCLMLTGSHTLDIKYGADRMPGRTGKLGRDLTLLPLKFSEYVMLIKPEIFKKIKKLKNLSVKEINNQVDNIIAFDSELKILFNQYLITGGFPLVINEFFSNKKIPDYVYEIYHRWVVGDIVKWGKSEKILTQLLKALILKQASTISWDSLAKESEIKSHKTVSSYIEDLENMFVLLILNFLDLNKKIPDFNKNKKLYILDPFIYHVFNKKIYFKENEINSSLIESAALTNIARFKKESSIYYWKNKREVDALLKIGKDIFPFEIKYQNNISKQDYKGLYHFNKGILITKNLLVKGEKYSAIPIHLFLALI